MDKNERILYFRQLQKQLSSFTDQEIEEGVTEYFLRKFGCHVGESNPTANEAVLQILTEVAFPVDLEYAIEFFESLLEVEAVEENGIVFTPKYIAEYIVSQAMEGIFEWSDDFTIVDPACGCGIFLIAAAEYVHNRFQIPMSHIIERNIFGFDIEEGNIRRCKLILKLLNAQYGGVLTDINNVFCCDSLKTNWNALIGRENVDFIIGNPPYVNPHDLNKDTVAFLKKTFQTTKSGVFNIFYAFIEQSMKYISAEGKLGFIIPNNFLSIKSATELRNFLQKEQYLRRILDFGDNMVFKPVRTYNCIILLDCEKKETFEYCVMERTDNVQSRLPHIEFAQMRTEDLDVNGWKLVDSSTRKNLLKIEGQAKQIKEFVRTGIATLKDAVYMVDRDECGFFKTVDGKRFDIESEIAVPLYKIPDLKLYNTLEEAKRYIIFPYEKRDGKFVLMSEADLKDKFPLTYDYLLEMKVLLDGRDKGKGVVGAWYAYGRTQGLNKYGKKLLFPTFANRPKFIYVEDEYALFVNGYAVFENDYLDLEVLCKVLNSSVMHYYVSQTSYPIEGGYYCYQKKYIERFSIPDFTETEIAYIRNASKEEVDDFLVRRYDLAI